MLTFYYFLFFHLFLFLEGVKNASHKYWWHLSFTWMKIYSPQETGLQAATNQRDYELVVYVYHKKRTPTPKYSPYLLVSPGLQRTSVTLSRLFYCLVELRHFKGESCRLQYIVYEELILLEGLSIPWYYMNYWSKAYYSLISDTINS